MSFYFERQIRSIRKARPCDGCGSTLEVGKPALRCSGHNDNNMWSATFHHDCRKAEERLNELHRTMWDDEWISLLDGMEWEDWPWLIEEFPAVAARMSITTERFEEVRDEQARVSKAWQEVYAKKALAPPPPIQSVDQNQGEGL